MSHRLHITHSCGIRNGIAWKDDTPFYAGPPAASPDFLLALYKTIGVDYPKFYKMDPLSKLGWLASEILFLEQPVPAGVPPEAVGMVFSNANSSLDTDRKYLDSANSVPSPGLFVYTLPNIMLGEIAIRRGFKGENAFFVFPDFDAAFLHQYVECLFAAGAVKYCIGGWVDLLGDHLDAFLFLVSANPGPHHFTTQALNSLYNDQPQNVSIQR